MSNPNTIGRFAPSPTGNLHFGSMLAAIASYCQTKSQKGKWLLRIEDIDPPREIKGSREAIIKILHKYGLHHDDEILLQSCDDRQHAYFKTLKRLQSTGLTYPCTCTRKQLSNHNIYPNTCRQNHFPNNKPHSIRIKIPNRSYHFQDLIQGQQTQNIAQQCGDFNVGRKDGLICYQLAVVLDDDYQGITEVIRGIDIMDSTARQMYLIEILGLRQPQYAHFPVITHAKGSKLSKQNHAAEITSEHPFEVTHMALKLLGQKPPIFKNQSQKELLKWAVKNWKIKQIDQTKTINFPKLAST
ncbi:MAG: tRNA glutamyl-Q(34) synthetase GluQRS [Proteobacteria bacterium]|nr:tRNA glutamyl-Q(34) synthetase GluQRS [Pseudomonadota bacterium]